MASGGADFGLTEKNRDIKVFPVPVDSENKSKVLKVWTFSAPHHRCFHLNWLSFFIAFFATFAAPPLIPVIRDNLDLTKQDISAAAIASVTGAVFSRILIGVVCDSYGPRYAHGVLQLLTSTATFCMATVSNSAGFIVLRMTVGFSLATFVACQFWCSVQFNARIVGSANAVAAGWGNAGGGFTQLIMPYIYQGMAAHQPNFIAWRCAYFVPAFAQVIIGLTVLSLGQDLPDGNYAELRKEGTMNKAKSHMEFWSAVKNYRTWVMVVTYGYCFGVELTVDNNIAPYLFDQFGISLQKAGVLGSVFGLSNVFARPLGGIVSDLVAKRFGIRGRLWVLWTAQTMGGVCAILMWATKETLGGTMAVVAFWSIFVPMACGATFGIAPFITRRGLGVATGLIGSGGNAGSSVTQAIFFTSSMSTPDGFKWMGVMIIGVAALLPLIHFPIAGWGSMFLPSKGITEEEYYCSDFTEAEKEKGLHRAVLNYASESRSQRSFRAMLDADAAAAEPVKKAGDAATLV